jgi:hypothetical protein
MFECFLNNIFLLYLPAYTSHVLQPLDLSVFSPIKAAYREAISHLALQTDGSSVGKQNFMICYCKARKKALTERNIRSGWKASGLWPVNIDKPLMSRLLLQPATPATQNNVEEGSSEPIGREEKEEPQNSVVTPFMVTPKRGQEVQSLGRTLAFKNKRNPEARLLFRKIGRSLDSKNMLLATQAAKIQALEAEVERWKPRKKQKVDMDPNKRFANIKSIMRTKERLASQLSARDLTTSYNFKDMCHEWSIN